MLKKIAYPITNHLVEGVVITLKAKAMAQSIIASSIPFANECLSEYTPNCREKIIRPRFPAMLIICTVPRVNASSCMR